MIKRIKEGDDLQEFEDIFDEEGSDIGTPTASTPITQSQITNPRHVTLGQLCTYLDKSDTTIREWVNKEGCPFFQKADKKKGIPWIFDISHVVRWYAERAAKQAVERVGVSEDGIISTDEAKRRRWVALAISSEIDTGEKLKEFVRVPVALARMSADYSRVRLALQAIPNAVSGRVPEKMREMVKQLITGAIEQALRSLVVPKNNDIEIEEAA